MRPVLQAMEQIHKKGIIHRDISPNNLMITKDHKLKLVDFGEAIKVEQGKEHSVLKNAGYSAMEQSSPQGELGPWTDIYALCATMYFMMTGLTPPEASARWISDTIQPLEIHLGKKQCQAVIKGMALEAKDRYADIHDLRQDLYSEEADRQEEVDFTLTTTTGTDTLMEQYKEQVGGSKKRGSGRNTDASKQSSGRKKKKHRALWITGGLRGHYSFFCADPGRTGIYGIGFRFIRRGVQFGLNAGERTIPDCCGDSGKQTGQYTQ